MPLISIAIVLLIPYVLAWLVAFGLRHVPVLAEEAGSDVIAINTIGRLTSRQRRALLIYMLPEIVFSLSALLLALIWQPDLGLNGTMLRWALVGMALVRLGISWPTWRDLLDGKALALSGPLRKIQVREQRALATEDGPFVVLPVERALFAAHDAGTPVTIFYALHSRRVVAVVPQPTDLNEPKSQPAPHVPTAGEHLPQL